MRLREGLVRTQNRVRVAGRRRAWWVGRGAMARQCAIVVQRCAQAREGEEEGGVLGQLGKSIIILLRNLKDFWTQQKWGMGCSLSLAVTGWICGSAAEWHRLEL